MRTFHLIQDYRFKQVFNMSEKLCLQWNDFQDNIKSAFQSLREDTDFSDVTLVNEDGQEVEAHKAILAASSPFFKGLLRKSKHPSPLIYMRGVKSDDLLAIVDFLYRGEANICQENLDSFFAIAEELQLNGLMRKADDKLEVDEKYIPPTSDPIITANSKMPKSSLDGKRPKSQIPKAKETGSLAIQNRFSGDLEELEERVKSLMEKSQNKLSDGRKAFSCKVCGKEDYKKNIKGHIEAKHFEGISLPCNICNRTFRSRYGLKQHNRQKCVDK